MIHEYRKKTPSTYNFLHCHFLFLIIIFFTISWRTEVEVMKQLPLCVGSVCATAIIITMIICKVSLETFFSLIIGLLIIIFVVADVIDL